MNEEKYIKSLFETARNQEPEISFEETSQAFEKSVRPGNGGNFRDWVLKNFNLNSLITISALGIILSAAFFGKDSQTNSSFEPSALNERLDSAGEINSDSLVPIKVTVETPDETVEIMMKAKPEDVKIEKTLRKQPAPEKRKNHKTEISLNDFSDEEIPEVPNQVDKKLKEEEKQVIPVISLNELKKKNREKTQNSAKVTSYPSGERLIQNARISGHKMSELEKVIGLSLNMEHLDDIFKKNRRSGFDQLTMISNGIFDHTIEVRHRGKQVIISPSNHSEGFRALGDFIDVKALTVGENESYFKFYYGSKIIEISLVKRDGVWFFDNSEINNERDNLSIEEMLVQKAFESEYLKEVFQKDDNGDFLPLTVYTNGYFSRGIDVYFNDKKVEIFFNKHQSKKTTTGPIVNVTKFKLKRKKVDFEFKYGAAKVSVELKKKKSDNWELKSIYHREKGKVYSDIRF